MIVTGGGRGIGAATARLAAAQGYAVCVNYRTDAKAAEAVAAEITDGGGRAIALQADVADEGAVEQLFAAVDRQLGPITALVNNAGLTGLAGRLDDVDGDTLRRVTAANVLGVFYCARAAVQRMSRKHGGEGGGIVNLSSGAATLGSANTYVWYAATKGAVDSFTIGLSKEVAGEGIRVNAVAPGFIKTEIHASSGMPDRMETEGHTVPIGRPAEAEEVAEPILWLLSDEASYVTGTILRVAGGR